MKNLICFELRKIFSKRLTQAALAAVLLLSAFLAFSTYQNKYASDGVGREGTGRDAVEIEKAVAAKYSGILTDEGVQRMLSELVPKSGKTDSTQSIFSRTPSSPPCPPALPMRRGIGTVCASPMYSATRPSKSAM